MKFLTLAAICLFICLNGWTQQKPAYILYNAKGKKVGFDKMIRLLSGNDIVLFGEYHNNPIAHWMELEIAMALHEKRQLVIGAEMFERDNQDAVEDYLAGKKDEKELALAARLWKNYPTDYAPVLNFAKEQHLVFAGTNIPRRYASLVAHGGLEALDTIAPAEKAWIAPLPIPYDPALPGYRKMLSMMGAGHGGENLPKAQAIKDATMAWFLLKYRKQGDLFFHLNGSYHSDNHDGIVWYLNQYQPGLKINTISTVSQKDIQSLLPENKGIADFIICVDTNMTNTY
ncbi:MAG TPA: ChaN family lipoprotein [Sediminibacterium sp.]|nr:ChaN family lipoprotein [Sediminibacterium sp.]